MAAACKDILVKLWIAGDDTATFRALANDWNANACTKHLESATVQLRDLPNLNNRSSCKEILWISHAACNKSLRSTLCDLTAFMLHNNRCDEVIATL